MPRARKKPLEIEYIQWTKENVGDVFEFITLDVDHNIEELNIANLAEGKLIIVTLEGNMQANVGDYIIKGIKGELYRCRAEVFKATYELIED
jgi:hypothetical protein